MAYRLEASESVGAGLRRVAAEELDAALEALARARGDAPDEPVHELRKGLKRLRALVRLARNELGELVFYRDNTCFRDAGRALSGARGAAALRGALGALAERYAARLDAAALARATHALDARHGAALATALEPAHLDGVQRALELARARVEGWSFTRDDFAVLEPGLRRTYREGRRALRAARLDSSAELAHDWRKRVKDHGYHVRLLTLAWPEQLRARRDAVDTLGELLGDDHDLAELLGTLGGERPPLAAGGEHAGLIELVLERQRELRAEALRLGELVYAERPRALARRFGEYFASWRGSAQGASDEEGCRSGASPTRDDSLSPPAARSRPR
ncbi:MAG: CHAD domain-containing protein [Sorangiineae bacterium]|nr:CHAD domain-containing protein [Polyangiaceae bacterium]MEB2324820.1 CHAD domain-containing protein [Sorangiineae bacterium]